MLQFEHLSRAALEDVKDRRRDHSAWLVATNLGKAAWDVAGRVWYITLVERLGNEADFKKCAKETISVADDEYGAATAKVVRDAWTAVGVLSNGEGPKGFIARGTKDATDDSETRRAPTDV